MAAGGSIAKGLLFIFRAGVRCRAITESIKRMAVDYSGRRAKKIVDRVATDPEPDWLAVCMPPLRLNLPREEDKPDVKIGAKDLVIIPYGDTSIYCYSADTNFTVIIRPSATCTYRSTVNMLDMMKLAGVRKYALVDITKGEEEYIRQLCIKTEQ